jgi:hypothetical protein
MTSTVKMIIGKISPLSRAVCHRNTDINNQRASTADRHVIVVVRIVRSGSSVPVKSHCILLFSPSSLSSPTVCACLALYVLGSIRLLAVRYEPLVVHLSCTMVGWTILTRWLVHPLCLCVRLIVRTGDSWSENSVQSNGAAQNRTNSGRGVVILCKITHLHPTRSDLEHGCSRETRSSSSQV